MHSRILAVATLFLCGAAVGRAGGPAFIAGSGYNPGVEGQALIWANGSVQYFTDQGNLSPILTGAQADGLVATAFGAWTSVSNAAVSATSGGHLAEDVNGSNIEIGGFGVITAPADITSSATGTPVGIVYDYDGTVTDALLGEGAGGLADCFTNAVYGGPDNFSSGGNIVHALVVINGVCAATSAQLPDVQYRLVRVLGRILGLGWSQANLNVLTGDPPPTSADYAGFPVMHFYDPIACVPISICYPNAAIPKMDDIDSLSRLYPGSGNPQPGGRVYGSVYFTDSAGNALQQMQGVNVVARLMVAGEPSRQYVVTSVSGFAFCGNAGNIIDGYLDGDGLPYGRWGSGDPSLEGFYDLGELMIPTGQTIAEYQLSVEALDSHLSRGVESYTPFQVTPSGTFAPVVVTVANQSNAERDILMLQDEIAQTHPGSGSTYAKPSALPQGGAWGSWISGYGSADFFQFTAQANRTASVAVTALDETGQPTETKLLPVIGIWELVDQSGNPAPAATQSAFNTITFGMTRLDAQFGVTEPFRVGIADFRGDGRPDYFYQANLLYADTVTPARASMAGGLATLDGIGFNPRLEVSVDGNSGSLLALAGSRMQVALPAGALDGAATIQLTDPASGSSSQMIGALTYGASSTDLLLLLQGNEPATAVGAVAASPLRARVVAADGVTPVNGATLAWSATNAAQLSVCNGAVSCSVLSDESGESSSLVTPTALGSSVVTIALAPASYSPPRSQSASVVGTSSTLDLAAVTPTRWIAQGATLAVPLTVETLDLGSPKAGVTINFALTAGTAKLSASSAVTDGSGLATISAQLTNQNSTVQVSACVAPGNSPCQTFTLFSTPASLWTLETVSGSAQLIVTGQSFQRLVMRVTDGSTSANPVMGAPVSFATTLTTGNDGRGGMPVVLGSSETPVASAQDGTAALLPSTGSVGPCDVVIAVSAGPAAALFQMESLAALAPQPPQLPKKLQFASVTSGRLPVYAPASAASAASLPAIYAFPEANVPDNTPLNPPAEPHAVECSDAPAANLSNAGDPPAAPAQDRSVGSPCGESKPAEAQAVSQVAQVASGADKSKASAPPTPDSSPVPTDWHPEDKRSCRALALEIPLL